MKKIKNNKLCLNKETIKELSELDVIVGGAPILTKTTDPFACPSPSVLTCPPTSCLGCP